jgi:phytol kinase
MQGPGAGDLLLTLLCYGYVLTMIQVANLLNERGISGSGSRKFLHAMIGNLPLVIPFFEWSFTPPLVAAPFILITLLASPHSPSPFMRKRLARLSNLTEGGHSLGLFLYACSYTLLAVLYPLKPHIIAAGVIPMAYGDTVAALVGMRFGRKVLLNGKTLEGTLGMFSASLLGLILSFTYFSRLYSFTLFEMLPATIVVAIVVAIAELLFPRGFDNLAVPLLGALAFVLMGGS